MLAALFATLSAASSPLFVVGGAPADPSDWPGVAVVRQDGVPHCAGVLVAPDVVLTAAHCALGATDVLLGARTEHDDDAEAIAVARIALHPDPWEGLDAAVLVLAAAAASAPARIVGCDVDTLLVPGAPATVLGYGRTTPTGEDDNIDLQAARVAIVDATCSDASLGCAANAPPQGELIAGGSGVDSCAGDSGGPLYLDGPLVVGVTSRGVITESVGCGAGGIYVRTDAVAAWVEAETGRVVREACEVEDAEGCNTATGPAGLGALLPLTLRRRRRARRPRPRSGDRRGR